MAALDALLRCVTVYECTVFNDMPIGVEIADRNWDKQTQQMSAVHYSIKYGIEVRHGYHGSTATPKGWLNLEAA